MAEANLNLKVDVNIRVWTDTGPFERCVICTMRGKITDGAGKNRAWECRGGWVLCDTHIKMFDAALEENKIKVRLAIDIPNGSYASPAIPDPNI